MEPNNSVLAGFKLEFDVAENPQRNCATDDARRCRGSDDPYSNQAALSEQSSAGGFRMFGLKVKLKTETSDTDLAEAEDPFTALNLQIKKEPLSKSGDEISDEDGTASRGPEHSGSNHAAASEQPSGAEFRMLGLKVRLKTETPDPSEAGDPFMGLNLQVKEEPISGSGDKTSDNDIEACDVSVADWHCKFFNSDHNFDNCERKTNNIKENNEVVIENQVSKAINSPKGTKYFNSDALKPRKLLSVKKKSNLAHAQQTGEMLAGDRSLAIKPSVEEVAAETQIRFAASCGENKQQPFVEEVTSKEFSDHQEIMKKHLKCYLRSKVLTGSFNLKTHQCIYAGDKTCKCKDCSKAFIQSEELKLHQCFHREEKTYKCTNCEKAFSRPLGLKRHQRIHTGVKPYQCTDCDKAFKNSSNLKTHQRIHSGNKPYQCTDCGKAFSQVQHLETHKRIHTGDKRYQCTECDKAFSDSSNLKKHQRIHTGDKPYHCTDCGKAFGQVQHLKAHQRIHKGDKPFQCMECDKAFSNSCHLKRHQRIHLEDKPYHCTDCSKAFSDSSTLRNHQRIHTGNKPYQCTDCGKAFKDSSSLKTHQRIHTGDKPYQCADCHKAFRQLHHLETHQRIHRGDKPYQCMECDKAFNNSSNLKRHQLIHTRDKQYHCRLHQSLQSCTITKETSTHAIRGQALPVYGL